MRGVEGTGQHSVVIFRWRNRKSDGVTLPTQTHTYKIDIVTLTSLTSKISMEGWWIVTTTARLELPTLRTVRMTMAAARASSPLVGSDEGGGGGE